MAIILLREFSYLQFQIKSLPETQGSRPYGRLRSPGQRSDLDVVMLSLQDDVGSMGLGETEKVDGC